MGQPSGISGLKLAFVFWVPVQLPPPSLSSSPMVHRWLLSVWGGFLLFVLFSVSHQPPSMQQRNSTDPRLQMLGDSLLEQGQEQEGFWLLLGLGGGFGVVPRLCSRFWCPAVSWWQWGCAPWQDTSWVSPGVPWGAQPRSPLLFPSAVTSEQIEHLHRRFRQLSRDQLTIRYGVPLPAAGRPPHTFRLPWGGARPCHPSQPSQEGCSIANKKKEVVKQWSGSKIAPAKLPLLPQP